MQGTLLLFNGIFTPQKEGCFKKKKMPPHAGIQFFKLPHHFFFFLFFHIHWVSQEKSKNKNSSRVLYMGYTALGMKCCWSKGGQTQCSKGHYPTLKRFVMNNSAYIFCTKHNADEQRMGTCTFVILSQRILPCSCLMPCYLSMITLVLYTVGNSEEKCINFNVTTCLVGILFCPLCSQGVMPQLPSITQHPQKKS